MGPVGDGLKITGFDFCSWSSPSEPPLTQIDTRSVRTMRTLCLELADFCNLFFNRFHIFGSACYIVSMARAKAPVFQRLVTQSFQAAGNPMPNSQPPASGTRQKSSSQGMPPSDPAQRAQLNNAPLQNAPNALIAASTLGQADPAQHYPLCCKFRARSDG